MDSYEDSLESDKVLIDLLFSLDRSPRIFQ